jgi:hypothetical protein
MRAAAGFKEQNANVEHIGERRVYNRLDLRPIEPAETAAKCQSSTS